MCHVLCAFFAGMLLDAYTVMPFHRPPISAFDCEGWWGGLSGKKCM